MVTGSRIDKPAYEWKLEDLENLVGFEEGQYLEFKKPKEFNTRKGQYSKDILSAELAETVSAFLNSDGGVLIIGVQTDPDKTNSQIEFLKKINDWNSNETFESQRISLNLPQIRDRIYGSLQPKPLGVDVSEIEVPLSDGSSTKVFVITTLASTTGAHQSLKTWRYYKRTGDGDVSMLDYEIRDVNNRRSGPLLALDIFVAGQSSVEAINRTDDGRGSWIEADQQPAPNGQPSFLAPLVLMTRNLGRGTAVDARFDLGIPASLILQPPSQYSGWTLSNTLEL